MIGASGVLIRDILVATGKLGGTEWLPGVLDQASRFNLGWLTVPVITLLGILGLLFVWWALKPRHKTHVAAEPAESSMWMRPVDIARLASGQASKINGVAGAKSVATRRRVQVSVRPSLQEDADVTDRVQASLERSVGALFPSMGVDVRTHRFSSGSAEHQSARMNGHMEGGEDAR